MYINIYSAWTIGTGAFKRECSVCVGGKRLSSCGYTNRPYIAYTCFFFVLVIFLYRFHRRCSINSSVSYMLRIWPNRTHRYDGRLYAENSKVIYDLFLSLHSAVPTHFLDEEETRATSKLDGLNRVTWRIPFAPLIT